MVAAGAMNSVKDNPQEVYLGRTISVTRPEDIDLIEEFYVRRMLQISRAPQIELLKDGQYKRL
jgi:hypothetical protein